MNEAEPKELLRAARRLVVKVGSSSLTRPDGHLSVARLNTLVESLAEYRAAGHQILLVSSGAQAAGMRPLKLKHKPRKLAEAQAAASVGQGLLIAQYTAAFGAFGLKVGQVLLTAEDVIRRAQYENARRALEELLRLGVVPVINENDTVATDEIRFGDNDRLAALVAHLASADGLVLLTDVDGLYTAKPSTPGAKRVPRVRSFDEVEKFEISSRGSDLGTGGMASKVAAAAVATSSGIPVLLTSAEALPVALKGEDTGTWFDVTGTRLPPRHLWLAYAADVNGQIVVDQGAAAAITRRDASLLPAGVVGGIGEFDSGDVVEIVSEQGKVLARGRTGFSGTRLAQVRGLAISQIEARFGPEFAHEAVHRDELVVMARHRRSKESSGLSCPEAGL